MSIPLENRINGNSANDFLNNTLYLVFVKIIGVLVTISDFVYVKIIYHLCGTIQNYPRHGVNVGN